MSVDLYSPIHLSLFDHQVLQAFTEAHKRNALTGDYRIDALDVICEGETLFGSSWGGTRALNREEVWYFPQISMSLGRLASQLRRQVGVERRGGG